MTYALRGREGSWSKRDDSTDRLREWDSDKGGRGSKNPKILLASFKYRPLDIVVQCIENGEIFAQDIIQSYLAIKVANENPDKEHFSSKV